jgi:hypothetical protein
MQKKLKVVTIGGGLDGDIGSHQGFGLGQQIA